MQNTLKTYSGAPIISVLSIALAVCIIVIYHLTVVKPMKDELARLQFAQSETLKEIGYVQNGVKSFEDYYNIREQAAGRK